jgi:hypothetical protein
VFDTVDHDYFVLNLEQNAVSTDSQPIFWREVGEVLDVSLEVILHEFHFFKNPLSQVGGQSPQVFDGFWFEDDFVSQGIVPIFGGLVVRNIIAQGSGSLICLNPSTFSILHSQFCHGQQQRRLNLLPHAAADVAIAVEAFDKEEVGIVVLLEEGLLGVGELPVVADVAVPDRHHLLQLRFQVIYK